MPASSAYSRPDILARLAPLGLHARRVVEGSITGQHRSPLHGVSVEFADYRQYAPGDDLKRLDWRAYARTGRFFIKRFEEETNLRCTFVVDASPSMAYPTAPAASVRRVAADSAAPVPANPPAVTPTTDAAAAFSKYDCAAVIAAALAGVLCHQRDASGLVIADQALRIAIRPSAKEAQLTLMLQLLAQHRPVGNGDPGDLGGVLVQVADQIQRRGLVVILSDLLTDQERFYEGLHRLQFQGHEIVVVQVLHPDEIDLPFDDSVRFRDMEGSEEVQAEPWAFRRAYREAMRAFIAEAGRRCRFAGIDHLPVRTSDDLADLLSQYLHQRQRNGEATARGRLSASSHAAAGGDGESSPS